MNSAFDEFVRIANGRRAARLRCYELHGFGDVIRPQRTYEVSFEGSTKIVVYKIVSIYRHFGYVKIKARDASGQIFFFQPEGNSTAFKGGTKWRRSFKEVSGVT